MEWGNDNGTDGGQQWGDEDSKWMDGGTRTVNGWGGQGQHRGDNNGDGLTCQTCSTCKV